MPAIPNGPRVQPDPQHARPCDLKTDLYVLQPERLNTSTPLKGKLTNCHSSGCERPFSVQKIPHSNLILLVVDKLCPCGSKKLDIDAQEVPGGTGKICFYPHMCSINAIKTCTLRCLWLSTPHQGAVAAQKAAQVHQLPSGGDRDPTVWPITSALRSASVCRHRCGAIDAHRCAPSVAIKYP